MTRKLILSMALAAALPAVSAPIVVSSGLVAYYSFDTDASDGSGNGHNATVVGATQVANGGHDGAGAYHFDGIDDKIYANGLNDVNSAVGGQNTVSFWMNWDRDYTSMPFSWGSVGGYDDLWLVTNYPGVGNNGFGFNSGNGDIYGISNIGLDGHWVQVTAIFENNLANGGGNALFINGVRQTLSPQAFGGVSYHAANPYIQISGWDAGPGYEFGGSIDELLVYNRALTDDEVMAVYRGEAATAAVPEPSSLALFVLGAAGLMAVVRRRSLQGRSVV